MAPKKKTKPADETPKITAAMLIERLRAMGGTGDGAMAVLTEVPLCTGGGERRIDALGMALWRSRGLELTAYETKVSRSDWLKELREPKKADGIYGYCDRFYLVVSDPAIVKQDELPPTWGLIVPRGDGVMIKVKGERNKNPKPISREFLAAIFRCATQQGVTQDRLDEAYRNGRRAGIAEESARRPISKGGERIDQYRVDAMTKRIALMEKAAKEFEEQTGIRWSEYEDGREIGLMIKVFRDLTWPFLADDIRRAIKNLQERLADCSQALGEIDKFRELKNDADRGAGSGADEGRKAADEVAG